MTMKNLTATLAGGFGYVLGARAGRQRYEQIRSLLNRVKPSSSTNGIQLEDSSYPSRQRNDLAVEA